MHTARYAAPRTTVGLGLLKGFALTAICNAGVERGRWLVSIGTPKSRTG